MINVLLLKYSDSPTMSYMDDWEDAFQLDTQFTVTVANIQCQQQVNAISKAITQFDLIFGLHSVLRTSASAEMLELLAAILDRRRGKFISLVGDEVNLHNSPLAVKLSALKNLAPDYVGTQLPLEAGRWLYEDIPTQVVSLPHALNQHYWFAQNDNKNRSLDIGAISVKYPIYLGDLDRNRLFECFLSIQKANPEEHKFALQNGEDVRLTRSGWRDFMRTCKGTISCEAGSDFLERNDATVFAVMQYLETVAKNAGKFIVKDGFPRRLYKAMPKKWRNLVKTKLRTTQLFGKTYSGIDELAYSSEYFKEVYEIFFKTYKRLPFATKAISSRHFEAIGTNTCQILIDGHYNGILERDRHYICLHRDLSNISEVVERFSDPSYRAAICRDAREMIIATNTFEHRLAYIKQLL